MHSSPHDFRTLFFQPSPIQALRTTINPIRSTRVQIYFGPSTDRPTATATAAASSQSIMFRQTCCPSSRDRRKAEWKDRAFREAKIVDRESQSEIPGPLLMQAATGGCT